LVLRLSSFKALDSFVLALLATTLIASLVPCRGFLATVLGRAADAAIVLLFFLHGARLSREAIVAGVTHVRLQLTVLLVTFLVFPVLGVLISRIPVLDPALAMGILYLTVLPSTVQSSIAFTSMANGNVPAAVCAATLSNLLGMFLTPALVAILMKMPRGSETFSLDSVWSIGLQLLLPFVVGHLVRPWLGAWVQSNKRLVGGLDRGSILLVVYTALSASVVEGLWSRLSIVSLLTLAAIGGLLLLAVLWLCWQLGRWLGLKREDRIVLLFCGSKKSLASGVPIAGALFSDAQVGIVLLPIMFFHQIQLIACAMLAKRLAVERR